MIPNTDPSVAAAEVRRCARLGLRGGDLPFKGLSAPLYHHAWHPVWEAAAECRFPISFHSTGFPGMHAPVIAKRPPRAEDPAHPAEWKVIRSSLFQLDGMEMLSPTLGSLPVASRARSFAATPGGCTASVDRPGGARGRGRDCSMIVR